METTDEAVPDMELLAPYYDDNTIKYAVAKVIPSDVTKKQQDKLCVDSLGWLELFVNFIN